MAFWTPYNQVLSLWNNQGEAANAVMGLKEDCPYLDKFLRENVYTDIKTEYELFWINNNMEGNQILIKYKDGTREFTPTKEINGCSLNIPGPFVLGLFNPFDADKQLKNEVYSKPNTKAGGVG